MSKKIRIRFVAQGKDDQLSPIEKLDYPLLLSLVKAARDRFQGSLRTQNIKVFIKIEVPDQKHCKYIKLTKQHEVMEFINDPQNKTIIVQFFHNKREESIRRIVTHIGQELEENERYLKNLTNELKDEVNQIYASNIIKRSTSNQEEEIIQVFMVICDPLVETEKDLDHNLVYYPLYHDEIDLPSHIQRLKTASLSNCDLTIKAKRVWGTKRELYECLKHGTGGDLQRKMFAIVQIYTRVEKREGVLMMSLEDDGEMGLRVWSDASQLFKQQMYANIIIIIGVGVDQLRELAQSLNFNRVLILISTISLEDSRIITSAYDRSLLDTENSYIDRYCQVFLQCFYENMFRRIDVRKSYQEAMNKAKEFSHKKLWCCCLHVHHQGCRWQKIVRRIGQSEAHRLLKHNVEDWNKNNLIASRRQLQGLLLGKEKETCCPQDTICCWQKVTTQTIKTFHTSFSRFIIWNQRQPDQVYSQLAPEQQRPNRFESDSYDKPSGRKRPLTIFLMVAYIMRNDICILRSNYISHVKRLFSSSREYLQGRIPSLFFHQFETFSLREAHFKKMIGQLIKQRSVARPFQRNNRRKELIIFLQYSHESNERCYQAILKDFAQLSSEQIDVKLKLVMLTDDVQLTSLRVKGMLKKSASKTQKSELSLKIQQQFDVEDDQQLQSYHNVLSKYSYNYVTEHFSEIGQKIQRGENYDQMRGTIDQQQLMSDNNIYIFLGFLSLFSQDGFYFNQVSYIILRKLFGVTLIEKALSKQLPVQYVSLQDYECLQLHKSYQSHFKKLQSNQKYSFQEKKLQYYYLITRLYFQFWPQADVFSYPSIIRQLMNKQGIFSIDIQRECHDYDDDVEEIERQISLGGTQMKSMLYDVSKAIHVYHLSQVQKILQQFLRKKRNKHNPTIATVSQSQFRKYGSFINQSQYKRFHYLLWNIIHKSWLMSQVLSKHYQESVKKFEVNLLIFFVQVEILLPIAEVARIQMHVLMNKSPPKLEDNQFGKLTAFLRLYRAYAFKEMTLSNYQPSWGNHHKCNDLFGNCYKLATKISEIIDASQTYPSMSQKAKKQYDDFKWYIKSKHKMFELCDAKKWTHEILKLIERKVLYYFCFSAQLKKNQSYSQFQQKVQAFEKHFNLTDILTKFIQLKKKLPPDILEENNTMLIDHYFKVQVEDIEVDEEKLLQFKGKISPEYLPIFNYLCQKMEQKALFNQNGLIIFARTRTMVCDGKPYIYTRKRTLLTEYLGKVFKEKELKISYFSLTEQTLNLFQITQQNNKCQVLCMILTVDASNPNELLFGSQTGVDTVKMPVQKFAQKICRCRIKILIICGKNSTKVCQRLKQLINDYQVMSMVEPTLAYSISQSQSSLHKMGQSMIRQPVAASAIRFSGSNRQKAAASTIKQSGSSSGKSKIYSSGIRNRQTPLSFEAFPTIIAIQSERFSLCDAEMSTYNSKDQPHEVSNISQSNRPSLFSNPRVSIAEAKNQMQESDSKFQNGEEDIDIDKLLEQYTQVEMVDTSGRNRFPLIFDRAESEKEQQVSQVELYLSNEVNQIAMDLMIISIVKNLTNRLSERDMNVTEALLKRIVEDSKKVAKHVLSNRFQCVQSVFEWFNYQIWANSLSPTISKIPRGTYEDLTKRFYCSENNLHDENYYENVGHCLELNKVFQAFNLKKINCIQILGGPKMGKSTFLQQICWICQTKGLFKFGVIKVDLKDGNLGPITARAFKNRANKTSQTGILIAIDNIDKNLSVYKEQLLKIRGKSFTLAYTVGKKEVGEEIRKILDITQYECINLYNISREQSNHFLYATLLSHIKQKNEFRFTAELLNAYQLKIDEIMKVIQREDPENKYSRALELLRGSNPKGPDEKANMFLNFYRQNFEELLNSLQEIKEIKIKVV